MLKRFLITLAAVLFAAAALAAVDVNNATQAELEAVKGIGPGIAAKILDERKKAPFKDWADLATASRVWARAMPPSSRPRD